MHFSMPVCSFRSGGGGGSKKYINQFIISYSADPTVRLYINHHRSSIFSYHNYQLRFAREKSRISILDSVDTRSSLPSALLEPDSFPSRQLNHRIVPIYLGCRDCRVNIAFWYKPYTEVDERKSRPARLYPRPRRVLEHCRDSDWKWPKQTASRSTIPIMHRNVGIT